MQWVADMTTEFDLKLEKYAELIVKVGLNIQSGQRLFVYASLTAAPLVRLIAAAAYRFGSPLVSVLWDDEQLILARFQHAPRDSFEEYETWKINGVIGFLEHGAAYLQVGSIDPDLLKDQNPQLIGIWQNTRAKNYLPVAKFQGNNTIS